MQGGGCRGVPKGAPDEGELDVFGSFSRRSEMSMDLAKLKDLVRGFSVADFSPIQTMAAALTTDGAKQ